jgi:chromosome segregation ATPase
VGIDTLSLTRFKGTVAVYSLEKFNLVVGPNGAGKSAIPEALQYAIEGTTRDSVLVALDDGFAFARGLMCEATQSGSKLTTSLQIQGRDGLSASMAAGAIAEHCGTFAPTFALSRFLALSPERQRDFVLKLCAAGRSDTSVGRLLERIRVAVLRDKLGTQHVDGHVYGGGQASHLWDQLSRPDRAALDQVIAAIEPDLGGEITSAIATALAEVKTITNQTKRDGDRARATAQELAGQKATLPVVAGAVADLQEQEAALRRQREECLEQLASQQGRAGARTTLERTIADCATRMQTAQVVLSELRAELDEHLGAPQTGDPSLAESPVMAARQAAEDASKGCENARVSVSNAERRVDQLAAEIGALQGSEWAKAQALVYQIDNVSQTSIGPWMQLCELIAKNAKEDRVSSLEGALKTAHVALATARTNLGAAETAVRTRNADFEQARKTEDIAKRIHVTLTDLGRANDERAKARCELENLHAAGGMVNVEDLQNQIAGIESRLCALADQIDAKRRLDNLNEAQLKAVALAEQQAKLHDMAKVVAEAIRAVRETLMGELIAPLLDRIRAFLAIAAPGRVPFCDLVGHTGKPRFELGWEDMREAGEYQSTKVTFDALSGGEQAIYGAALALAMVSLANVPLRLLWP